MNSGITLQEINRLFDFLKQSKTNDKMTILITNDMCKSLHDLMENCAKYQDKLQSNWNSLKEWLKTDEQKYFTFQPRQNGKTLQAGIKVGLDMVLDKMNELESCDSNES